MMKYYITGSNLFGQWLCDGLFLSDFVTCKTINKFKDIASQADLLQINWSYNLLRKDSTFYISGCWNGEEQQLVEIPLPSECTECKTDLLIAGNDYKIILVCKNKNVLWVMDLKKENNFKKIKLSMEMPLADDLKRPKIITSIIKVELKDESCLYLTSEGNVYCGMLPSYVDTSHCTGKVCDIQCGYGHYVILTEEGRVYTWGNGRRLQLGHGDLCNLDTPKEVEALAGIEITKICCGGWHSLALSIFGDVYAWGWNDIGQLGIKILSEDHESYAVPTLINLFDENGKEIDINVKDIACGSRHSAILLEDNTVWTTGCNKYGQLGFSDKKQLSLKCFRKTFHCNGECSLMCGPWSTVLISK